MQTYTVNFAVSTDPNATATSGFSSSSTMNDLYMDVQATGQSQAEAMVVAMYGGPIKCYVKSVRLK